MWDVVVIGPPGAGKATITGSMLFKYGGIDMFTMQVLEEEQIQTRDRGQTYKDALNNLRSHEIDLKFPTPTDKEVTIRESGGRAECAILVLPADSPISEEYLKGLSVRAEKLIIVINKMDIINWSEVQFQKIVASLGRIAQNVPIIQISALNGDNVVEKSLNPPWYKGWKGNRRSGETLLRAIDLSLEWWS